MKIKTRSILSGYIPFVYGLIFAAYSFRDLFVRSLYPGGVWDYPSDTSYQSKMKFPHYSNVENIYSKSNRTIQLGVLK